LSSELPSEPLSVPELLNRRRAEGASALAVITAQDSLTYGQLEHESRAIAARLIALLGLSKGSRVGLLMENGTGWVSIALAVMRIGAVLVPLSTFLQRGELQEQLSVAAVQHLIVTPGFNGRAYLDEMAQLADLQGAGCSWLGGVRNPGVPSLRSVIDAVDLRKGALAQSEGAGDDLVREMGAQVTPADDLVIMFTSGSSGRAKGCIHTHGSAIRGVLTSLPSRGVRSDDRLYLPMPLFWTGGFGMGLLTALISGCALITEAIPEPERTLELLSESRVTLFRGWPDQAVKLAQHPRFAEADLSSLRPGSLDALMPLSERAAAPNARASLLGMTETFGPYCCYPLDRDMPQDKWGSAGLVQPNTSVRILDRETGADLPAGRSGLIAIKGAQLMRGICGREHHEVFDERGFYHTGDLGRVDADGFLFYEGRSDDMFKASGATVYPSEVERALQEIPGVVRAFVTGVPVAGSGETEVGAAVVAAPASGINADSLGGQLRGRLSAFKRPRRWLIYRSMEDVPMLPSGKVDKRALCAALLNARR
jgi:acyl-CoA synthetase (AMP-forming)/AMP-acid ligase II